MLFFIDESYSESYTIKDTYRRSNGTEKRLHIPKIKHKLRCISVKQVLLEADKGIITCFVTQIVTLLFVMAINLS